MTDKNGFTLLEILVTLAIFAVLSIITYNGLSSMIRTRSVVAAEAEKLAQLQKAFTHMARDIEQATTRGIRDENNSFQPAMALNGMPLSGFEFTRSGWRNPAAKLRSNLQRVAYQLNDKNLHRIHWQVLDRLPASVPIKRMVLDGVENFEVLFFNSAGQWLTNWPPPRPENGMEFTEYRNILPLAVSVTFTLEKFGEITRIFTVCGQEAKSMGEE